MFIFFFNDTATTEIYTLSLHAALPIWGGELRRQRLEPVTPASREHEPCARVRERESAGLADSRAGAGRSEEHTSELQSRQYLECRLLLEKKNKLLSAHHD